jgi:sedoheptulose-bisphosphatase
MFVPRWHLILASGNGMKVAFDPLDGSSVIASNFAVGSIFGVWPGGALLGQRVGNQAAAVYSVYGSRTAMVLARPVGGDCRKACT